jgi:hypothetical protein
MSKYDNTNGNKDIDRDISIEPIVAITRARRIGTNTLPSSQPDMQRIMRVEIPLKALFTSENL